MELLNKLHCCKLQQRYYDLVKDGKKKFELRANDLKRQNMKVGDVIMFESENKEFMLKEIEARYEGDSLEEMIRMIGVEFLLPGIRTVKEGLKIYEAFSGYKDKGREYNIVVFKLKE
jgi:ASC-1-like (ASCH) protein